MLRFYILLLTGLALLLLGSLRADTPPGTPAKGPLSPRDEQATFRLPKGFRIELVACEPDVIDPVAMAFDEDGRLYVAEMRGYPNAGVGTGTITSGRIKLLQDRDGDGYFETSTVFAEGLRFPQGVQPWRKGLLVPMAPNILYLEDTDGDGKADQQRVLYTNFALANIQQLVNSLQFGLDNWIHGVAGGNGGSVRSAEKPDLPAVELRSRGVRFRPDVPGSLEPTSGGGQYGLTPDDYGRWFVNTNSQHLRHIVLPDHYLRRNPYLAVSAVTLDIPDHGPACQVHRISAFEAWRVERTSQRRDGPNASRFPTTELVPGGYITSACSPVVYTADAFPESYRNNVFICEPANNLIHRDVLAPKGATFTASRGDADCEFLASTDNWFRPVQATVGPDGALYVLDFYREVIETPLSLPEDIKKKLNLESRGRGRIWRISADSDGKPRPRVRPSLGKASAAELVGYLEHPNRWWRLTAQRLLYQRQERSIKPALEQLAQNSKSGPGRAHALWTLEGLQILDNAIIRRALLDPEPGVREQALRLADSRLASSSELRQAVVHMTDDPSPRVRFQLAFTLGEADYADGMVALMRLAVRDGEDPWTQTALLSSSHRCAASLLQTIAGERIFTREASAARLQLLRRLASQVGARGIESEVVSVLAWLNGPEPAIEAWQVAILEGLAAGMQNGPRGLERLWTAPPAELRQAAARAKAVFEQAGIRAVEAKRPLAARLAAVQMLGYGPFALLEKAAPDLVNPQTPPELQLAAVRALALQRDPAVPALLLAAWGAYSPAVRREVQEALFARADRLPALLDAVERKAIPPMQLDPLRVEQLRKHADARIRQRAQVLLSGQLAPARQKVVEDFRPALELLSDLKRGQAVFVKNCITCHRLDNQGREVGPDLASALRDKSPEQLLISILDPSREVDSRYLNYVVITRAGRSLSGLIAAETASSVTLRRGDQAEDTVLRSQIEDIQATTKSLMPDGLELQINRQDMADLIAYLREVGSRKK